MKKRIDGTNRMITAFLAMTIVFLSMSMSIYAWFSLSKSLKDPIEFTTGATEVRLKMYMGRVPAAASCQEGDSHPGQEITREETLCKINDATGIGQVGMARPSMTEGATAYTVNLADVSFGVLGSLGDPDPENIIYLRLEVPAGNGTNFHFAMSYGKGSYINLYKHPDGDGDASHYVPMDMPAQVTQADKDHNGFLRFQYALSTEYFSLDGQPKEIDGVKPVTIIEAQSRDDSPLQFIGDDGTTDDWIDFNTYTCSDANANRPANFFYPDDVANLSSTDPYYLYIKIVPNPDAFAQAIDSFPSDCFMDFSIRAQFEISGETETEQPTA